jgi:hypothetical protein
MKPEGHEVLDEQTAKEISEESRRGPFKFSMCGIKPGEKVQFTDNPSIEAVVVDDRHIEYNGETTSLSALAQKIKGFDHPVQGTVWFTYKGERLSDLRDRLEKEDTK